MAKPSQYAHVVLNCQDSGGVFCKNILWYELVGVFGGGYNIATAANALQAHFQTELLNLLSSDVAFVGLDVRINNAGVSSDVSTYPGLTGNGAAGPVPNEVAAIVHWQTSTPGGSGRGRTYFTLFEADWVAGGRMKTAALTVLNALATKINASFTDQGISWQFRVYSRLLDAMIPVTSFVSDQLVGTQRRRRPTR